MKKLYESPELIAVQFNNADIVSVSAVKTTGDKGIIANKSINVANLE